VIDPVALTQKLVQFPSVSPDSGESIDCISQILSDNAFQCFRIDRNGIPNLYARYGDGTPNLCFSGHTDVVPQGDSDLWDYPPFSGEISDNLLWGRGSVDMKSGVAASISAMLEYVQSNQSACGSISCMITGDEEGIATDGTLAIIDWLKNRHEVVDHCIVCEPSCDKRIGDTIKIGRRGSLNCHLTALGKSGHTAYPSRASNPIPVLVKVLHHLSSATLDAGNSYFDPSNLVITTLDVGNKASNVIPDSARAAFNIRFNSLHTSENLKRWISTEIANCLAGDDSVSLAIETKGNAEAFLTPPCILTSLLKKSIHDVIQDSDLEIALSTSGGTSDARFIQELCPVIEFGLRNKGIHAINERVSVEDIHTLKQIYFRILTRYFLTH
jgi:succinyl-diaminopimelate desuccinylase